ncbi:hypothetical protein [Psychrobacter maritimus]|uniref:hypothetical protein n=1 Tax=Psychrobacter maritimus TaxID=256325 RepID=UPI0039AF800F
MGHTKLLNDVIDKRALDKLIPIDSPHHIQMRQLVIDVISLVPDGDIDLLHSILESNSVDFTGIDCEDAIEQTIRQGKTEPPRLYRRVIYLSQAAMPDRVKLS